MPPRRAPQRGGKQQRRRLDRFHPSDVGQCTSHLSNVNPSTTTPPVGGSHLLHLLPTALRGTADWTPIIHKPRMKRTSAMDDRLSSLGLLHYVQVGNMQLDRPLIKGLAMFWRPETHTFHFPVGEMTVTLEDVAFLLGLPTTGQVVTGRTDYDYKALTMELALLEATSDDVAAECFRPGKPYHILLTKLRGMWPHEPTSDWPVDRLDRYTRAFVLELFGCELFPDSTGNAVPAIYLSLLRDVRSNCSVKWNWGAAVLAMLYRGLDTAALQNGGVSIPGPWLFLQLWSYARLLACRPTDKKPFDGWGKPSLDACSPYGRKWTRLGTKKFLVPYRSGIDYVRDVLMLMEDKAIVWRPYEEKKHLMPLLAQQPQCLFRLRVPCVHFWVVEWQHADRVMHQFDKFQTVPPPAPVAWSRMEQLHRCEQSTYRGIDWKDLFRDEVAMWTDTSQVLVHEDRPWTETNMAEYLRWFRVHGGVQHIPIPVAAAVGPAADLQYLHQLPTNMEHVKHTLRDALWACTLVVTKGFRRIGKSMLRSCCTHLDIAGEPHRLQHLLESKGLPPDIESIPETDDEGDLPQADEIQFMQGDFTLHEWDMYFDVPRPTQARQVPSREERTQHPQSQPQPPPPQSQCSQARPQYSGAVLALPALVPPVLDSVQSL